LAWVIPGSAAAAAVAGGALWTAGGLASVLAGRGWRSPPFTLTTAIAVLTHGTDRFWPGTDPRLLLALAAALAALVLLPAAVLLLRGYLNAPAADDPRRSLARGVHLAPMLRRHAAVRAQHLRPSLAGRRPSRLTDGEVGVLLGRLGTKPRAAEVFCSWEDVAVAFMAPRSGKTTALAVPVTLAAPGPVVLTSNKTEGWKETAALREAQTGERVWTFDPQRIAHTPQSWWWNPLRELTTVAEANRLAGHFVATIEDDRRDIWGPAARELLATLLLAAAVSGGTLLDVYAWLADEATPIPGGLLRTATTCWPGPCAAPRTAPRRPAAASTSPPAPPPPACATTRSPPGSPHQPTTAPTAPITVVGPITLVRRMLQAGWLGRWWSSGRRRSPAPGRPCTC